MPDDVLIDHRNARMVGFHRPVTRVHAPGWANRSMPPADVASAAGERVCLPIEQRAPARKSRR